MCAIGKAGGFDILPIYRNKRSGTLPDSLLAVLGTANKHWEVSLHCRYLCWISVVLSGHNRMLNDKDRDYLDGQLTLLAHLLMLLRSVGWDECLQ